MREILARKSLSLLFFKIIFLILLICPEILDAQEIVIKSFDDWALQNNISEPVEYKKSIIEGLETFKEGSYRKAAELFGKAAIINPYHPLPNFYLACSLFCLRQYSLSGEIMRRVCGSYSGWESLPLNFYKIFPVHKNFKEDLAHFEKWLFQERRSLDSYFLFGLLCQFSGEPAKAEIAYRSILNQDNLYKEAGLFLEMIVGKKMPVSYPSFRDLKEKGELYLQEEKYDLAIEIWSTALVFHPERTESLYYLSCALGASGRFSQSAAFLKLALRESPQLLQEQMQFQSRLNKSGTKWLGRLEKYFQKTSNRPDILFLLGYFYSVVGEKQKAGLAFKHLKKEVAYSEMVDLLMKTLSDQEQQKK